MERLLNFFFAIPPLAAIVSVFALTCAEAALFVGFVIPGETAVVLGGVLASRGIVPIGAIIAASVGGAIVGDSIGFLVGRRYGSALLERRFPRYWPLLRAWLNRRGAAAVLLGRLTAFLRAVVPTAAGAARLPPGRFLLWNVLGGAAWGTGFSLFGYFVGEGYEAALRGAGRASTAATLLVVGLVGFYVAKRLVVRSWLKGTEGPGTRDF